VIQKQHVKALEEGMGVFKKITQHYFGDDFSIYHMWGCIKPK
jgi:hypothetical protein